MNNFTIHNSFLNGAIFLALLAISLFFFRFHQSTRDRLFGFFSAAFALLALEHLCLEFLAINGEAKLYLIRLTAFLLILLAIWDKNRKSEKP
jgi:hypothetical protein